jgi:hypothetical protein
MKETQTGIQFPQFRPKNISNWLFWKGEAHEWTSPTREMKKLRRLRIGRRRTTIYCLSSTKQVIEANADAKLFAVNYLWAIRYTALNTTRYNEVMKQSMIDVIACGLLTLCRYQRGDVRYTTIKSNVESFIEKWEAWWLVLGNHEKKGTADRRPHQWWRVSLAEY